MNTLTIICISFAAYPVGSALCELTGDLISNIGSKKRVTVESDRVKNEVYALTGLYPEAALDMECTTGEPKFCYIHNGEKYEINKTK